MNRRLLQITLVALSGAALVLAGGPQQALAQAENGQQFGFHVGGFVDEDGDGFNDLAPDADGDGIPNGLDPDYVPPRDGTGNRLGQLNGGESGLHQLMHRWQYMWLRMFGGGGETPGQGGWGPGDGTGFGPGSGCGISSNDLRQPRNGRGR